MGNKGVMRQKMGAILTLLAMVVTAWQLVMCVVRIHTGWVVDGIYWNIVLYEAMILAEGYLILWFISDRKYKKFRQNIALHEQMEKKSSLFK